MNDLYITLPSSVRSVTHENTLADYIADLPYTVELDGDWEVGLVELSFTKSWYNIMTPQDVGLQLNELVTRRYMKPDKVMPGRYTEHQLIDRVNELLKAHTNETVEITDSSTGNTIVVQKMIREFFNDIIEESPKVTLNPITRKATISLVQDKDGCTFFPVLGEEISALLGFSEKDMTTAVIHENNRKVLEGSRAFDFEAGIYCIYVYSDVVKPVLIGDTSAACLRVCAIPSEKKFGENCTISFNSPSYYPISSRRFKSVRITLKDKTNRKMPFQFGETLVKLHFRKKNGSL